MPRGPKRCVRRTRTSLILYAQALCDSFLVGIPTEEQRKNLHDCMCTALELDADQIKKDSDELKAEAAGKSEADFLAMPELKVSPTCLLY